MKKVFDTKKHFGLEEITPEEEEMLKELYKEYSKPMSYQSSLILTFIIEAIERQEEPEKIMKIMTDSMMASFALGYQKAFTKKKEGVN